MRSAVLVLVLVACSIATSCSSSDLDDEEPREWPFRLATIEEIEEVDRLGLDDPLATDEWFPFAASHWPFPEPIRLLREAGIGCQIEFSMCTYYNVPPDKVAEARRVVRPYLDDRRMWVH